MKVAQARRRWIRDLIAYTLAGALTSALVGAGLGLVSATVFPSGTGRAGLLIALAVAALAATRELGVPAIPLPQMRRRTPGIWAKTVTAPAAPMLWGLDLGLFFTTLFTFAGPWLLVALALLGGSAGFGAAIFVAYWAGRALSVWLAPMLLPDRESTPQMMLTIDAELRVFQLAHVAALAMAAAVLVWMAMESMSL